MQHIHARQYLRGGAAVRIDCDHQCNVLVMDDHNYSLYRHNASYRYHGGFYERLPASVEVPSTGHWNVVIDLAGGRANIRYDIRYFE
ncbi:MULTISPECIES: DUF1883 domain-containing protein [unclassified Sphingomonas]|jgi:hypothetical protein|uniref:DUF1883 domain-containing protein n=1 Tax=unclassified Sphingomonas TaxID=196159 RepID=UPI00104AF458|nr:MULTISPECIES: DUF1883 domain-containing protein [unclassified Sphingomonas]MDY0968683.1 DUF1883 domain-containing protein [Sphingomonas sp. CFBP9021]TCQ01476.1 uncharacterized protein DUF1883 [Sphingomonas sp. PP-F2F-A104-K0414]